MVLPLDNDCDDCIPEWARQRSFMATATPALPFFVTFLIVAFAISQKLFPLLSGQIEDNAIHSAHSKNRQRKTWRLANTIFSSNFALSAVLVELILCEISNTINQVSRTLALRATLSSLLFLLIVATPALEIYSVVSKNISSKGGSNSWRKTIWMLEFSGLAVWLGGFWYLGRGLLGSYLHEKSYVHSHTLTEGCLERIGIIGVSLMASLAGFAAISSIWQTFGAKVRMVTEADIVRKQAGVQATNDMLLTKESRLRAVERKLSDQPQQGLMGRIVGTVRGNLDIQERTALELEIRGLQTMRNTLQNSLAMLQSRRQSQQRSNTVHGRLFNVASYLFALYCTYRVGATALATLRRLSSSHTSFSSSDPINNFLALLARHWDPMIDREAWSRTISFLLSGVMLLLSFNSALQTFYVFARLIPGILHQTKTNFALIISQIAATYVISSALLLRSNLPPEMKGKIGDVLGAPLEPAFTENWFEGWFLASSLMTVVGLWLGKVFKEGEWDDGDSGGGGGGGGDDDDVEMGKMN